MERVLDHIDNHLDASLDLAALSDVAHFSPFHFHRLFAAWMGETLGDYLRRRRLEEGAFRLALQPSASILDVALSVGFGSGEAFARAFKLHFGCTPTAWKRDSPQRHAVLSAISQNKRIQHYRNLDQALSNPSQEAHRSFVHHERSKYPLRENIMNVNVVELSPTKIAYLRHVGPYGSSVGKFWSDVFNPWVASQGLGNQTLYGISQDDPSTTPPGKCRYDACVEVPENFVATGSALLTTLPGGRYAVTQFQGTSDSIGSAWDAFFRDWLPKSGLEFDARPCFERYSKDTCVDEHTGVFTCDLCIPVRPL